MMTIQKYKMGTYIRTEEHRKKQAELKYAKKNPNWHGKETGYHGIHSWIRRNKTKLELCENCKKEKPYDLANISGEYKRDINDYKWLCRKCHMEEDGRLNDRIINLRKLDEEKVKKIKLLLSIGQTHIDIAKQFNIGRSAITDINTRRTWGNLNINQEKEVMI